MSPLLPQSHAPVFRVFTVMALPLRSPPEVTGEGRTRVTGPSQQLQTEREDRGPQEKGRDQGSASKSMTQMGAEVQPLSEAAPMSAPGLGHSLNYCSHPKAPAQTPQYSPSVLSTHSSVLADATSFS